MRIPVNTHGGHLSECYVIGMTHIREAVEQLRGVAHNQVPDAQFALVIAATALLSAVNAATLKPTQCALWLRRPVPPEQRNFFYRGFNAVYNRVEAGYSRLISRLVAFRSFLRCC